MALKYDTFQKKLGAEPYYEGLHTGAPGFTFIKYASVFRTMTFHGIDVRNETGQCGDQPPMEDWLVVITHICERVVMGYMWFILKVIGRNVKNT